MINEKKTANPINFRCVHRHNGLSHPSCYIKYLSGDSRFAKRLPKVLVFDIETSPLKAYIFATRLWNTNVSEEQVLSEWFMLCWSAKWLFDDKIISDRLTSREAKREDDSRIVKSLWKLLDEADIVIAHNGCFAKGHKVLKTDLTWCDVSDLKVGDRLIAFNEEVPDPANPKSKRKYEISVVEDVRPIIKKCSKVVLKNGKEFIVSNDHPWLVKRSGLHWKYKKTEELMHFNGLNTVSKVIDTWENVDSYHAGYLAAFLDGEGCIVQSKRQDRESGYHNSISFSQKDGEIIKKLEESLKYFNFRYSVILGYDKNHKDISRISLLGGLSEVLRFLGITQSSKKLRFDVELLKESPLYLKENIDIDYIEDIGDHEVIGLQTSSRTYIVDGFPVHNSKFDVPNMNTRFIVNGLPPTSPYQTIDTCSIAKRQFGFSHNNLNALARVFGFKPKLETNFQLWKSCVDGNEKALQRMELYNKGDVDTLEEVYMKIRPWIHSHPNLALYTESTESMCSNCMSTNIIKTDKFYYTSTGRYELYRCECGAYIRVRTSSLSKDKRKTLLVGVAR